MGSDLPFTLGRLNCCCTNPTSCNRGGMEELCSPGVSGVTEEGRARRHTQVDTVQRFKLPKPVLCAGGLLRVELLGRAQRQDADLLWFVALAHARLLLIYLCLIRHQPQACLLIWKYRLRAIAPTGHGVRLLIIIIIIIIIII